MNLAVVGSGIAGMLISYLLHQHGHQVIVLEANDYAGGHTHTHALTQGGSTYRVDSWFIVFNDWTYPNFMRLLKLLHIPSQPTTMSFSVHDDASGLEYN